MNEFEFANADLFDITDAEIDGWCDESDYTDDEPLILSGLMFDWPSDGWQNAEPPF